MDYHNSDDMWNIDNNLTLTLDQIKLRTRSWWFAELDKLQAMFIACLRGRSPSLSKKQLKMYIMKIPEINIEIEEGKLLLAAIAKIAEQEKDKNLNRILDEISKLKEKMEL